MMASLIKMKEIGTDKMRVEMMKNKKKMMNNITKESIDKFYIY